MKLVSVPKYHKLNTFVPTYQDLNEKESDLKKYAISSLGFNALYIDTQQLFLLTMINHSRPIYQKYLNHNEKAEPIPQ
jgi:hypothetical protein